ncbi:hypothetical protein NV379_19315 [Paenibacillus sp. N1-5-1-14]|uniref:hypothetical protein n=1 Tax=Paenibacillus radicibacter TaxID=2972488 RepID=UPI002158E7C7|nr:hypothetical protein [Paenibacillus radicibacter]MCR8644805.1 hypothetical protein [Paenibacillus radicibacter]
MKGMFTLDAAVIDPSITMPQFFIILVFVLLIGSLVSLGILRFFQANKKSGTTFIGLSAVSAAVFIFVVNLF